MAPHGSADVPAHTRRSRPPRSRAGQPQPGQPSAGQPRAGRPRTDPARRAAYDVLRAVADRDAYANLLLPALLSERGLAGRDAAFATELTYGTLRGRGTYDAILTACSDRDEIDPPVRDVLRLGAHQLLATRVGSHAAVATSVDLAKDVCGPRPSGFVNAVLRRVATRDLDAWVQIVAPDKSRDPSGYLAVRHSYPRWIVDAFRDALGPASAAETEDALAAGNVQDEASQLAALALTRIGVPGEDKLWLDLCAGPGGKARLLGGLAAARGARLVASDIHPHRARRVLDALSHAGGGNHGVIAADGRQMPWPPGTLDRVLADVPCSGLGSLRRRPEARWRKVPADVTELAVLQRELLNAAIDSVRPGGVVAYVTCSPHLAETRDVVSAVAQSRDDVTILDAPAVLPEVPGLRPAHSRPDPRFAQFWPHRHGTDAIFLALLRRGE